MNQMSGPYSNSTPSFVEGANESGEMSETDKTATESGEISGLEVKDQTLMSGVWDKITEFAKNLFSSSSSHDDYHSMEHHSPFDPASTSHDSHESVSHDSSTAQVPHSFSSNTSINTRFTAEGAAKLAAIAKQRGDLTQNLTQEVKAKGYDMTFETRYSGIGFKINASSEEELGKVKEMLRDLLPDLTNEDLEIRFSESTGQIIGHLSEELCAKHFAT